jgi:flagellar assembly protein FliH
MAAPAKFLFDLDFGAPSGSKEATTISIAAHEAALAEAETRGYRNGLAAAESQARKEEAQAHAEAERRTAAAFEQIAAGLQRLAQSLAAVEARFEAEAVDVAVAVGSKLAGALIACEPLAEIGALAEGCFRELLAAPHVVVRVNEDLYARAKEKLEDIARGRGFEGRLVVMGTADIAAGDCRIEWADGGLVRDRAATEAAIADAVERFVAVRRNGAGIDMGGPDNGR